MLENLKENGINLKVYFLIFIVIVIILTFLISIFNKNNYFKDYIIVSESLILSKKGNTWVQISKIDENILEKKYNVVGDFGKVGGVSINYNKDANEFFYLDKNYKDLELKYPLAAYTNGFKKLKCPEFDVLEYESSDDVFISKAISNREIADFEDSLFKSIYDLDGDGIKESIYTISNYNDYHTIFLVSGDNYVGKLDSDTSENYMVRSIIDLDGDGIYEIIVSKGDVDISTFDSVYQIYNYKNGKMKKIMG